MTILTMHKGNEYLTFRIETDGSAKETNTGFNMPDFAVCFEVLCNNGWKTVASTEIPEDKVERKGKGEIITFPDNTFRNQWDEYLTEYSDNLEVAYVM